MIPKPIWDEQAEFNALLRTPPHENGEGAIAEFVRDMTLNTFAECSELLQTTAWKLHRRDRRHQPNRDHRLEECIDLFKLWLTIVQGLGLTQEELEDAYWRKSMVVRQRHSEEWVKQIDSPFVVFDIDNVLCDYTVGFANWMRSNAPGVDYGKISRIITDRLWFSHGSDFGITDVEWNRLKHVFRSGGGFRALPPMLGAPAFLSRCRMAGFKIVLLTARCVDRYPNVYGDTLHWLQKYGFVYDWVWWSRDKGNRILEELDAKQYVKFAVDDDPKYVLQFAGAGFETFWLKGTNFNIDEKEADTIMSLKGVKSIRQLDEISLTDYI